MSGDALIVQPLEKCPRSHNKTKGSEHRNRSAGQKSEQGVAVYNPLRHQLHIKSKKRRNALIYDQNIKLKLKYPSHAVLILLVLVERKKKKSISSENKVVVLRLLTTGATCWFRSSLIYVTS